MKTEILSEAEIEKADEAAVLQRFLHGTPVPPEVSARVDARAEAITERLRKTYGETIDIDQIEDGHVMLAIPSLHVIVMGRTLDEARAWARAAIADCSVPLSQPVELTVTASEALEPPNSNAA